MHKQNNRLVRATELLETELKLRLRTTDVFGEDTLRTLATKSLSHAGGWKHCSHHQFHLFPPPHGCFLLLRDTLSLACVRRWAVVVLGLAETQRPVLSPSETRRRTFSLPFAACTERK